MASVGMAMIPPMVSVAAFISTEHACGFATDPHALEVVRNIKNRSDGTSTRGPAIELGFAPGTVGKESSR